MRQLLKRVAGELRMSTDSSYSEYRKLVKNIAREDGLPLADCSGEAEVLNSYEQSLRTGGVDRSTVKWLLGEGSLPGVGAGLNLLAYSFHYSKAEKSHPPLGLAFEAKFGAVEKDYSAYLRRCPYAFGLGEAYLPLLRMQRQAYSRAEFKRILSHLAAYA